jgi:hypothetical protein
VLVSTRIQPEGGELVVSGRTAAGAWEQRVRIAPVEGNGAVTALFGREAVEDLETRLAAGANRSDIDTLVEKLGLEYRISTRLTSWVAIDKTPSVDPRAPTRRESVPQMLPYGTSIEGLGLRGPADGHGGPVLMSAGRLAAPLAAAAGAPPGPMMRMRVVAEAPPRPQPPQSKAPSEQGGSLLGRAFGALLRAGRVTTTPTDRVRGRVVKRTGTTIVIEIEVLAELDWNEAALAVATARVELADGSVIDAKVDIAQSTRTARLLSGQRAKLTLVLASEPLSAARLVRFEPDFGLYIPLE